MGENTSEKEPQKPQHSSIKLLQKMNTLEKEYQIFIQSSSTIKKPLKKYNSFDDLVHFDSSPRNLMSALQQQHPTTKTSSTRRRSSSFSYCSPSTITGSSGEVWRVRENELAMDDIRRERKLAFESGKLRGRRLFHEESDVSYDEDEDIHSVCDEIYYVGEVVKENTRAVKERKLGDHFTCFAKGKMLIILALMVFVFGIISMGRFDGYGREVKVFVMFPT